MPVSQAKPAEHVPTIDASAGLYVHVPFCASTCDFCAFYQEKPHRDDLLRYLDGMERELDQWRAEWEKLTNPADPMGERAGKAPPVTIFFGGGTPGLLSAKDLGRLCEAVRERVPGPIVEWSVEMAPSTVKADKVRAMLDAGVTRISLGVQSFNETLLDALGRRHSPKQVREAYETLRQGGCKNVNLDLIFAVPGQMADQWRADMAAAIELGPEHLSTYCLTFEEDTKLWVKLTRGELRRDIGSEADLYKLTWETLGAAGYPQYEVSNFASPGFACAHNVSTWRMGAWRGVGPSAASQWCGYRWSNPADLKVWLDGLDQPAGDDSLPVGAEDVVRLDNELLAADALIFGLRMNAGVNLAELRQRFPGGGAADAPLWGELIEEGLLQRRGEQIWLTDEGRMIADAIGGRLMEISV